MFDISRWYKKIARVLMASAIAGVIALAIASCSDRVSSATRDRQDNIAQPNTVSTSTTARTGNIAEASPPAVIQQLNQALEQYRPQVKILSPQADQVLPDNTVSVRLQVQDLPIFQDAKLGLGPHLNVILDNQPFISVYDLNQPLVLSNLAPGTHTLRAIAARPWDESFKNQGAYTQTKFHVLTKTEDNNPSSEQPLLTYISPQGSYGAEPILLDFYLTNAPLHLVAEENREDDIADWRIRCTINGESFVLDRWQAIYLKGFKKGNNWVQLEFLDEQGNSVKNVFNNTVRIINYESRGKDTLSKLVKGDLSATAARAIVEPNYNAKLPVVTTPSAAPEDKQNPTLPQQPTSEPEVGEEQPQEQPKTEQLEPATENHLNESQQQPKEFFDDRENNAPLHNLTPTTPEAIEPPAPESTPLAPPIPEPSATPAQPEVTPPSAVEPTPTVAPKFEIEPQPTPQPKYRSFLNRFRRRVTTPPHNLSPVPEILEPEPSELVPPEVLESPAKNS